MMLRVVLPPESPTTYLAWIGFTLDAECRVCGDRRLRQEAEASGFLVGADAEESRRSLFGVIAEQAGQALRRGQREVAPVMRTDPVRLAGVLGYAERWGAWLAGANLRQAELAVPDLSVAALRRLALQSMRDQLTNGSRPSARVPSVE